MFTMANAETDQKLYLFYDEYPADIYQSDLFCGAIVYSPEADGIKLLKNQDELNEILRNWRLRAFSGYVNRTKTINFYTNKLKSSDVGMVSGVNLLWETMFSCCLVNFLINFYGYIQPPPIVIIYDKKVWGRDTRKIFMTL